MTKPCNDVQTKYNYNPHTLHHLKSTRLKRIVIIRINITIQNQFEAIFEKTIPHDSRVRLSHEAYICPFLCKYIMHIVLNRF